MATKLTEEQINDIAERCGCGYFEYGDAQGEVRLDFARAIEQATALRIMLILAE